VWTILRYSALENTILHFIWANEIFIGFDFNCYQRSFLSFAIQASNKFKTSILFSFSVKTFWQGNMAAVNWLIFIAWSNGNQLVICSYNFLYRSYTWIKSQFAPKSFVTKIGWNWNNRARLAYFEIIGPGLRI
jgi:hypothetical protein